MPDGAREGDVTETKSLQEVMQEHPQLCAMGYRPKWAADEFGVFSGSRADLAADVEQFEKARAWISENLEPRKTFNHFYHSYVLKHICERHTGYITNGTFIAAMIAKGYNVRTFPGTLNPCFNVTNASVRRVVLIDTQAARP